MGLLGVLSRRWICPSDPGVASRSRVAAFASGPITCCRAARSPPPNA
ncbi:hypothetical protein APV28_5108 [Comamonas testosteroni]|nr:hypothetical protein APV28_5108 [Comamonas testosteroni]